MAARENQGLQAALIVFVMLTIILIVTTYLFFSSYSEQREKAKAMAEQKSSADQAAQTALAEFDRIKTVIGAAQTDQIEAIEEAANKDLETHGEGLPDSEQNYRALVARLADQVRKSEAEKAELTAEAQALRDKLAANDLAAEDEVAQYKTKLDETAADLESERGKFGEDRGRLTQQMDAIRKQFESTQAQAEQESRTSGERIASLSKELGRSESLRIDLQNKEQREREASEYPDGKVTRVSQRSRLAWLDIGSADGLKTQTTFVVVGHDEGNPNRTEPKAKLEVIRLLDDHHSEARIVEDDLSDPIMPGDNVFSIVWEAGHREHFALAGLMDIDGDGEDDRERLRDLIALNGGVIDAEAGLDGGKTGELSIHTKYLVEGERPQSEGGNVQGWTDLRGEADRLGVRTIGLAEFLRYMGYEREQSAVNLGKFADPSDFRPRLPNGVQRVMPGSETPRDLRKPRGAVREVPY
ncbi:MAG: hypothetical protein DWQ37_02630 [Planctomycetota bacterium]|nr:MAG: hypothetical protein DWQ37_02630 [Planctomycetota bacterium]